MCAISDLSLIWCLSPQHRQSISAIRGHSNRFSSRRGQKAVSSKTMYVHATHSLCCLRSFIPIQEHIRKCGQSHHSCAISIETDFSIISGPLGDQLCSQATWEENLSTWPGNQATWGLQVQQWLLVAQHSDMVFTYVLLSTTLLQRVLICELLYMVAQ